MATKSTNTQGNPYHDEATGEFTSADGSGSKGGQSQQDMKTDLSQPNTNPSPTVKSFKFRFKGKVEDVRNDLRQSRQVSSIPFLGSARDIEEHLEEFFPAEVVKNIDSKFGKFSIPYKYFNLRTDPEQRCGVNIFAACIGKKRWANNHLKLIDYNEYQKLSRNPNYQTLWRGLRGNDTAFETIANSYSSKENEMIYGSVGGTCYGIAVYASSNKWEAVSYAGQNQRHVMDLVLDKNARTMNYNTICRIRDDFSSNKTSILQRVEKIFIDNGIEPSRAKTMATSFGYTMDDEGFIAMLCGVEWYRSDSYHMIENLGSMYRLLK